MSCNVFGSSAGQKATRKVRVRGCLKTVFVERVTRSIPNMRAAIPDIQVMPLPFLRNTTCSGSTWPHVRRRRARADKMSNCQFLTPPLKKWQRGQVGFGGGGGPPCCADNTQSLFAKGVPLRSSGPPQLGDWGL